MRAVGAVPDDELPTHQNVRWCYRCNAHHAAKAFPPDIRVEDGLSHYCSGAEVVLCVRCQKPVSTDQARKEGRRTYCRKCAPRSASKQQVKEYAAAGD